MHIVLQPKEWKKKTQGTPETFILTKEKDNSMDKTGRFLSTTKLVLQTELRVQLASDDNK